MRPFRQTWLAEFVAQRGERRPTSASPEQFVGVDLDRLQFSWVSAAEGGKWVEVVTDLTEKVRAMGPMVEFKELATEEQWSGAIDSPELKEAYNQI